MRRWLIIFVLFVVPLQLVWGSVVTYCEHEAKPAAEKHFGHHEHEHQGAGAEQAVNDDGGNNLTVGDLDCATCHLGASAVLPLLVVVIPDFSSCPLRAEHDSGHESHIPSGLDRPDRFELPAAVRFGGGVEFAPVPD